MVILGVTGSIAAHKAIDLTSQMTKDGLDVHVVLSSDAMQFVTPLPFKTLSRNPVVTGLYDEEEGWKPAHIRLADEADLLLVAPATANKIAQLALGLASDALSCLALALNSEARMLVAPAMHGRMWAHPATQGNVEILRARGVEFIGPEAGLLSCGYEGMGRLWSTDGIAERVRTILGRR
jgi:phosphopantothenoylcysteine synthetase/decarboxylase